MGLSKHVRLYMELGGPKLNYWHTTLSWMGPKINLKLKTLNHKLLMAS